MITNPILQVSLPNAISVRNIGGMLLFLAFTIGLVHPTHADNRTPTVGAPGFIEDLVLPGTELTGKPINDKDPIIVRVVKAIKHGDGFRYEIRFQGLEAGKFDLSQWLIRKDGSEAKGLPAIDIEIKSLLPPGQITPNELEEGWIPQLGGYRRIATAIAILWAIILLGLIFIRPKTKQAEQIHEKQASLAELLFALLGKAQNNQVSPGQYAELERMLVGMWRRKLGLEQLPVDEALRKIRDHEQAGPLIRQLERWMHSPKRDQNLDLAALVEPYQQMNLNDADQLKAQLKQIHSGGRS